MNSFSEQSRKFSERLAKQLTHWDGSETEPLEILYQSAHAHEQFYELLLEGLIKHSTAKGSSWLIKHAHENGKPLDRAQVETVMQLLAHLQHWETRLHILQCLPYWEIPQSGHYPLEHFLRKNLMDENKFVRAWAYNGFCELAHQQPTLRGEAKHFVELAMSDEAASIKARLRNILKDKKFDWITVE